MTPAVLGLMVLATAAPQQQMAQLNVPAGPLVQSLNRLAAQAEVDVILAVDLRGRQSAHLAGSMSPEAALRRMVAGQNARVVRVGRRQYRIEAAMRPRTVAVAAVVAAPVASAEPVQLSEVVITAPAGRGAMDEVSGRSVIDGAVVNPSGAPIGAEAVSDLAAGVDSTRQGAGRNKVFIRGVADSGFSGVLQSTVGQYFGDFRLGFGSPDPDLALIDIRQVDIFEGPQAGRFGAGSIGGIIRVTPEPPALDEVSSRVVVGATATDGGAAGGDLSFIGNRPLGQGAVRFVAWGRSDGGFIDNPVRGLKDVDRVDLLGGRLGLRTTIGAWTVDGLALYQRTAGEDAQSVADPDVLHKTADVAEPYSDEVALLGVTGTRRLGAGRLTSTFGVSRQVVDERFDVIDYMTLSPAVLDRRHTSLTLSSETRLEAALRPWLAWNGGVSIAWTEAEATRRQNNEIGVAPWPLVSRRRSEGEAALFGEAILTPTDSVKVSLGGRLSAVRAASRLIAPLWAIRDDTASTVEFAATPSLGLSWRRGGLTAFARYEEAERPGGVTEAAKGVKIYESDRIALAEAGVRWRLPGGSAKISAGRMDWSDIQADFVTPGGDLTVRNAGDGVIEFLDMKAAWSPTANLTMSGGLFVNDSRLRVSDFLVVGVANGEIPNVARVGANLAAGYDAGRIGPWPLRLNGTLRYIGKSRLGLEAPLDVEQGGYVRAEFTARLGDDRRAATLSISNPFNETATRFGLSSPYSLLDPQVAPLRPLTVRLGFDAAF